MPLSTARVGRTVAGVLGRHTLATALTAVALRVLRPELDGGWFRVRPGERELHRRLGVRHYRRLLRAVAWDRVVTRWRSFDGTRAGLASLDRHTRLSEATHLGGAVAGTLLVVRARRGGAGAVLLGLAIHLHPVVLQRSLRARIHAVRR
ncbi:hypothetical protein [Pseudonocardia abyssalis]|jgi:hypothetical protein|uniref:Glycosyl-4,4'-diaponeurosporenoate acyltransferase n=1 Tax=Pseudonocardia abyssalis TaxID=2792008 RepID=A0ABS6UN12_9PSEU|nr:hypothetical protein [Pseudonocardia abyssalis]MBW0115245.1 hypothetical protein [Pseudonocardia abyssalis]MBW0133641.1 hypothetical protein [Pseudonocardia abyssalis]